MSPRVIATIQKNIIARLQHCNTSSLETTKRNNSTHTQILRARTAAPHTAQLATLRRVCAVRFRRTKSPPIRILTLLVVAIASRRAHWPTTHLHRSDKTETIPHTHTHTSCARRPLRHTQLNSPRHAECVQCDFAAKSPPIRFSTLLVVAIASRRAHCTGPPPTHPSASQPRARRAARTSATCTCSRRATLAGSTAAEGALCVLCVMRVCWCVSTVCLSRCVRAFLL